jgi:hypothetical protein
LEHEEWTQLGERILEANPEKYQRLIVLLRKIAKAEERLASNDIQILLQLVRTKLVTTS